MRTPVSIATPIATLVAPVVVIFALGAPGCAPRVDVSEPSPFEEDDPAAMPERPESASERRAATGPSVASRPTVRERHRRFEVLRTELDQILDRGPAPILRGLEVKAVFDGDRFRGWQIVQFIRGQVRFDHVDLMPGDVIRRVNRVVVAHPDHLGRLWGDLRSASSITIEVNREGEDFELRFDVLDDAKAASP